MFTNNNISPIDRNYVQEIEFWITELYTATQKILIYCSWLDVSVCLYTFTFLICWFGWTAPQVVHVIPGASPQAAAARPNLKPVQNAPTLHDWQLPAKYRRAPLSQQEVDFINVSMAHANNARDMSLLYYIATSHQLRDNMSEALKLILLLQRGGPEWTLTPD